MKKYPMKKTKSLKIGMGISKETVSFPQNYFCSFPIVGIDPGVNFGLSVLIHSSAFVFSGKIPEKDRMNYGLWMYNLVCSVGETVKAIYIEGASYGEKFGQIVLEQIRYSCFLAGKTIGVPAYYVPPLTARMIVFGSGKIKGSEVWKEINPHGADSLVLAIYGSKKVGSS